MVFKTWTEEQSKKLLNSYERVSIKELALLTGHSRGAVAGKMRELGLKKKIGNIVRFKEVNLTERDMAYIAGLVDGEGTVTIRKATGRKGAVEYHPYIRISNTSKELMDWLEQKLNFPNVYIAKQKTRAGTPMYIFNIRGMSFYKFFRELEPYLIIKRRRMRVMLLWIESRFKASSYEGYSTYQMELIRAIRWLNVKPLRQSPADMPSILQSIT